MGRALATALIAALLIGPGLVLPPVTGERCDAAEAQGAPKNPRGRRAPPKPRTGSELRTDTVPSVVAPAPPVPPVTDPMSVAAAQAPAAEPVEKVEADVSTRNVPIKLGFKGTEIIVFGSVMNSRQPSPESGYYDMVVVLEGRSTPLVVRRKSSIGGVWVNTSPFVFERAPSYYAIVSTAPVEEIADGKVLAETAIGFEHMKIRPREGRVRSYSDEELKTYHDAVVRLKQKEGLYIEQPHDVTFTGQSLFRATVQLPANIAVGPVEVHVYLFKDGKLLSQQSRRVILEREGLEAWLYWFANVYPFFYGVFTVAFAVCAGLLASAFFRRGSH